MKLKTISQLACKGKRVLVRIDINSEVAKVKVQNNPRFKAHSETIKALKNKGAKIVILAHQGRPKGKDFTSLKQHAKILSKYTKVKFVNDILGKKAINSIRNLKNGEAILLDNVRGLKEEYNSGNNKMVKILGDECDYFVQDAFSISHRNQSSIVDFPRKLPSYIGKVMELELKSLDTLKKKSKGAVFMLGGTKSKDLILLLKNKKILSSGKLSLLCLKAKGYKLGKEDKELKEDLGLVRIIKKNTKNITVPKDLAIKIDGKRKEISLEELPSKYLLLDIGSETIELYKKEIKKAKAIFFKGAPGYSEDRVFAKGTRELLRAVAKSKAYSVVAGGSSAGAVDKFKINKKGFSHISLSGGALVHYLAGKKLPGIEALHR